jgi:hypothetical protein
VGAAGRVGNSTVCGSPDLVITCWQPTSTAAPVTSSGSATPPAITWSVTEVGGSLVQFGATGSINIKPGRVYDVSAHAQTPSGVRSLVVGGSGSWACRSGDVGQATTADLATQTSRQQPTDGQAWDTLTTFETIGVASQPCSNGFTFSSGGFSLTATATNFAGMIRTGHLAMVITP